MREQPSLMYQPTRPKHHLTAQWKPTDQLPRPLKKRTLPNQARCTTNQLPKLRQKKTHPSHTTKSNLLQRPRQKKILPSRVRFTTNPWKTRPNPKFTINQLRMPNQQRSITSQWMHRTKQNLILLKYLSYIYTIYSFKFSAIVTSYHNFCLFELKFSFKWMVSSLYKPWIKWRHLKPN